MKRVKQMNQTKGILTVAAILLLATCLPTNASLVTVRFDPPTQFVQLGDTFTVNIVADISSPLVGWGLDVSSTPRDVLIGSVSAPTIGPAWTAAYAADGDGLAGLAFPTSVSGTNVLLATLHFHADALGTTDLTLSVTPGDTTEGFALDPTGFATTTFEPGTITVIPEPASLLLLVAGVLPFWRRRG